MKSRGIWLCVVVISLAAALLIYFILVTEPTPTIKPAQAAQELNVQTLNNVLNIRGGEGCIHSSPTKMVWVYQGPAPSMGFSEVPTVIVRSHLGDDFHVSIRDKEYYGKKYVEVTFDKEGR